MAFLIYRVLQGKILSKVSSFHLYANPHDLLWCKSFGIRPAIAEQRGVS